MLSLSLQRADTDSLYCNPTEDGGSTKSGGAPSVKSVKSSTSSASVKSGSPSTKSRSTTKSKSSTSSVPKSANWKASIDPLGMSSKSNGAAGLFSTSLYSPGFQMPSANSSAAGQPKAFQNKQLKFVEKKRTGSSAASTKSGKSGKSDKTAMSSADSKSVKSSSSSTKSTFLSSFTGSFSTQGESPISLPGGDKKSSSKSDDAAKVFNDTDSAYGGSDGKASVTNTAELTVVVEDHSSSGASVHPFDKTTAANANSSDTYHRRPSVADSITQLQPPTQKVSHTPNELLLKRVISWEYLGRVHHGKMVYYNTILLTEADLRRLYAPEVMQKRTHQYFLLGMSIANILDIPHLSDYAKSLSAILHEFELFQSTESKTKMQSFFKSGKKVPDEEAGEYVHLEVKAVPFEMDYTVIFATLCEMIAQAYKKFDTHKASIIIDSDVFHKIDVRFKKLLSMATRELEALTREAMQEELYFLDPITEGWDEQVPSLAY
ncbi:hypothetical protein EDD11_005076 [Mortierella claussenii]|nr:hypothetical protein EDD11_005076 [Mortierella claussenii]